MRYEYLTNEPLDRALSAYTQALGTLTRRTERVRVQDALGRITSEAVYAHICAPPVSYTHLDVYKRQVHNRSFCLRVRAPSALKFNLSRLLHPNGFQHRQSGGKCQGCRKSKHGAGIAKQSDCDNTSRCRALSYI